MATYVGNIRRVYRTYFPTIENPLSEGGQWWNGGTDGIDWHNMRVQTAGQVFGLQTGESFTDGTALVKGYWNPDQGCRGQIFTPGVGIDAQFPECELRTRSLITANINRGYEFTYSVTPSHLYIDIVSWHGAKGDFDIIAEVDGLPAPASGDYIEAKSIGNRHSTSVNGVEVLAVIDTEWQDGAPGIGHNADPSDGTNNNLYGFLFFEAWDYHGAWRKNMPHSQRSFAGRR